MGSTLLYAVRCAASCIAVNLEWRLKLTPMGIALLFHFTIRRLRISAPLVPPTNEGSFVWLKYWLVSRRNMGPFWGLLQTQILIDALPTHPYLLRNGSDIDLFGRE